MRTYFAALVILGLVYYAHVAGLNGLYMKIQAYDIFMHIFGGIGIGLFALAIMDHNAPAIAHKRRKIVMWVILAGLLWEFFEAYYDIAGYHLGTKMYYIDTVKDLFDDVVGGTLVAYFLARPANK